MKKMTRIPELRDGEVRGGVAAAEVAVDQRTREERFEGEGYWWG